MKGRKLKNRFNISSEAVVLIDNYKNISQLLQTMGVVDGPDKRIVDLAGKVAKELGVTTNIVMADLETRVRDARQKRISDSGKCRVLGIDKYSNEDWVHGEFNTPDEALREARELTTESKPLASDHSIATVYLAYDPQGNYLGGDVWIGE